MRNPSRRNRNIGTNRQGHGQDNRMSISVPFWSPLYFTEQLGAYSVKEYDVNGQQVRIVTEALRSDCIHACTAEEIVAVLTCIPPADLKDLRLIVLRQPKRKEYLLQPVWGRLSYAYEFEGELQAAILLEAVPKDVTHTWSRKLSPADQHELEQFRAEGHHVLEDKRSFRVRSSPEAARQTQLFRTLPHEVGHYVHYLSYAEQPAGEPALLEPDKRVDWYFRLPSAEKERFAEGYATRMRPVILTRSGL